jgi:polyribonucleotide nucleotidyltransferase
LAKDGGNVILATVVSERGHLSKGDAEGEGGGTPFTVEYREKPAASGRIPRTPNRRESTTEAETLTGRAIDRCLRPLFPPLYASETQLVASVQAYDRASPDPPVSLATNAASAALHASDVPWAGPVGCVRVALVKNKFVAEPTKAELDASPLDLLYAGTDERTLMIEVSAREVRSACDALCSPQLQPPSPKSITPRRSKLPPFRAVVANVRWCSL